MSKIREDKSAAGLRLRRRLARRATRSPGMENFPIPALLLKIMGRRKLLALVEDTRPRLRRD